MTTDTKTASRPLAILKLPKYQASHLVAYARSIVMAMTNNPSFPSPNPPMATVEAAIDALGEAEAATLSRTKGTVEERNEKRLALKMLLERLCSYVQVAADADPERAVSIIESAGLAVKKMAGPRPRVFSARPGRASGSVQLVAPKAGNRAAYEWQYSTDGMKTWVTLPVTVQATTFVEGLAPGSTAYFRFRTATKAGTSDWVQPLSTIVV